MKFADSKSSLLQTPRRALGDMKNVNVTPVAFRVPTRMKNSFDIFPNGTKSTKPSLTSLGKECAHLEQVS